MCIGGAVLCAPTDGGGGGGAVVWVGGDVLWAGLIDIAPAGLVDGAVSKPGMGVRETDCCGGPRHCGGAPPIPDPERPRPLIPKKDPVPVAVGIGILTVASTRDEWPGSRKRNNW